MTPSCRPPGDIPASFAVSGPRSPVHFEKAVIVGVGLMGGSLGLDLRRLGIAERVVGVGRTPATLARALAVGAIDEYTTDAREAACGADLVVVCAPVLAVPGLLEQMAPAVRADALITDMGSTKARIAAVGARLYGRRFVAGHPMAGSEASGVEAARTDLFRDAAWAVVRCEPFCLEEDPDAARLADLAAALGARPIPLDALRHDRLVALISHLPHMISFAFSNAVAADPESEAARSLGGGSFRDLMRVSGSDPSLWNGIFLENREALLEALDSYGEQLAALRRALTDGQPVLGDGR